METCKGISGQPLSVVEINKKVGQMGKLSDWYGEKIENPYDLEVNLNGELVVIRTDTDSPIDIKRETLPSNSATKQLLEDLDNEKL